MVGPVGRPSRPPDRRLVLNPRPAPAIARAGIFSVPPQRAQPSISVPKPPHRRALVRFLTRVPFGCPPYRFMPSGEACTGVRLDVSP
jgi:hypothetical protein